MTIIQKIIEQLHDRLNAIYCDPTRQAERARIQRQIVCLECFLIDLAPIN